ncbi:squalene--hopene cyclase [Glacieibacterium sp.]|uniref:squalene--hopene cyclase n=1 Tax=Glacieibacterium sp. TaxID=2860237 RepID=UPI003B000848
MLADATTDSLDTSVHRAADALAALQKPDGHFVFELEADVTIPAEYILLRHYLGEPDDLDLEARIGRYIRRVQGDHGGWPLYHDGPFDISATVKGYYALKMIGDDIAAPHMVRAREAVLSAGGAAATNVFTRIQLALFGAGPWRTVPTMPPEIILLPRWFPVHLSKMAYWARTVIVPLLVLQNLRPLARNPRGIKVDELFLPRSTVRPKSNVAEAKFVWKVGFGALDWLLKHCNGLWPKRQRARAIEACRSFVVERLNGDDGLGAIYPAIANSVMMFDALGYGPEHPDRAIARAAVEKLIVRRDDGEIYCQPCLSPVWDTALAAHALLEVRSAEAETQALAALDWLVPRQVLDVAGDWAEERPGVRPGGWAFQYNNAHYPDLDDTAVVVLAMERARGAVGDRYDEAIARGREWTLGLQSRDGGWGAFDADNSYHYLNNIPFADHGALLDPPTADVTARCVSMLAQLGEGGAEPAMDALTYLGRDQQADGSWFGRWGVNYIYGTWSVLCALNAAGIAPSTPAVSSAVDWLTRIQNADGGWGEDCDSYALDYAGYKPAASRASQTGWALLGLMAAGEVDSDAVARGVAWLQATQAEDGLWPEEQHTGGGFPRVFYLRYHGYAKIFPLWALARYRNLRRSNERRVAFGM